MKKFKKVLALALALALALSLSMPVFAAEETTPISREGHTFTAYQIFKGVEEDGVLVNINWGTGIKDPVAFIEALKANSAFEVNKEDGSKVNAFEDVPAENSPKSADAVARVVATFKDKDNEAEAFAQVVDAQIDPDTTPSFAEGATLDAGYYLVVDTTPTLPTEAPVRNLSILAFITGGTFNPVMKVDAPTLDKEVLEVNDSAPVGDDAWGEVADYDIGDDVSFKLTGKVPAGYDEFKTYKFVFHDTMSSGLTFNANSIEVTVDGDPIEAGENTYTVVTSDIGEETFQVVFNNLKNIPAVHAGSVIVVTYTATLNEGAQVKEENDAHLEFSNNPNDDGDGDTGNTPNDKVTVFTFKLAVDKVDGEGKPLPDAGFTLYKWDADVEGDDKYVQVGDEIMVTANGDDFTAKFEGLDAGWYKLVETTVPTGYNKADDILFKIEATEVENENGEAEVTSLTVLVQNADGQYEEAKNFTVTTDKDEVDTTIENLKGLQLPSTGGIGTTIFYTVGGLLVVAAVVLLITKKRMGKAE